MKKEALFQRLKGGVIISCQALKDEPLYFESGGVMPRVAKAMELAGAAGIRCNSERDIREICSTVTVPVIGLIKKDYPDTSVYITTTINEVDSIVNAGADIVALDATKRMRPGDISSADFLKQVREKYDILIMADVSTYEEGIAAWEAGADIVSTTMSGYTPYSGNGCEGPDFKLIECLARALKIPVVAEGRFHQPSEVRQAFDLGAFAVVVGGAITRPQEIAQRFLGEVFG